MTSIYVKNACIAGAAVLMATISLLADAAEDSAQAPQDKAYLTAKNVDWSLRLPKDDKVEYRGVVNFDNAGREHNGILYPGMLGAAGFFAAIIAHGVVVEGMKNSQKSEIQKKADTVLGPYQPVLEKYTHQELMQEALNKATTRWSRKLIAFSDKPGTERIVDSIPIFSLSQDQSTIILENVISIYNPAAPSTPAYQNIVRVVSKAKDEPELASYWIADEGKKLKDESARLFSYSLDVMLKDATNSATESLPQKTFRYREGAIEKMERAELVNEECNRVVIKTLRGWLMSIPVQPVADASTNSCRDFF